MRAWPTSQRRNDRSAIYDDARRRPFTLQPKVTQRTGPIDGFEHKLSILISRIDSQFHLRTGRTTGEIERWFQKRKDAAISWLLPNPRRKASSFGTVDDKEV